MCHGLMDSIRIERYQGTAKSNIRNTSFYFNISNPERLSVRWIERESRYAFRGTDGPDKITRV